VLALEPNNLTTLDVAERVKKAMEEKGVVLDDKDVMPTPEEVVAAAPKQKPRKKRGGRKFAAKATVAAVEEVEEQKIAEAIKEEEVEEQLRQVKLVFGEDIRWAQVPARCSMVQLRKAVRSKFPRLKAILVNYKDKEGDLVTITNQDELK
jgi:DNA polymerase II small subunit/DNA polymerase delta subunit B